MIPTNKIEALRYRAQVALDPLPYQQARLLPKLRQDRPLRFAVMTERPDVLDELLREVHATATCDAPLVPFAGLIHDMGPATAHEREMQLPARWPAGQIVELCDAVLERREESGDRTRRHDGPWFLGPSTLRPMAKVGALDGVRATHGRDTTREVLADFMDQVEPPAEFFGVIIADDPLDPEAKIEADGANEWFRKTLAKRINAGKITYSDEPPRALKDAAEKAMARIPAAHSLDPSDIKVTMGGVGLFNYVGGIDYATDPPATTVSTFAVTDVGPVLLDVHELEPEDPTR